MIRIDIKYHCEEAPMTLSRDFRMTDVSLHGGILIDYLNIY